MSLTYGEPVAFLQIMKIKFYKCNTQAVRILPAHDPNRTILLPAHNLFVGQQYTNY